MVDACAKLSGLKVEILYFLVYHTQDSGNVHISGGISSSSSHSVAEKISSSQNRFELVGALLQAIAADLKSRSGQQLSFHIGVESFVDHDHLSGPFELSSTEKGCFR